MKLILMALLLISCGKREEPKALDYSDSDGDQRLNYQEAGLDRYLANFEVLGPIEGILRVYGERLFETEVSNQQSLGAQIFDLMVQSEGRRFVERFFDESSRLHLSQSIPASLGVPGSTQLVLRFSAESAQADEIVLVTAQSRIVLAPWARELKFTLPENQLRSLAQGEAYLAVRRRPTRGKFFSEDTEQSIREKSYRVYVHDGRKGSANYISKELPYEDYLRAQGISPFIVTSEDVFFFSDALVPEEGWFQRELRNGDRILVRSRFEELRSRFLARFTVRRKVLERINGVPSSALALENRPGAKVYLRVRSGEQVTRKFKEVKEERTHAQADGSSEGSGGAYIDCTHYLRRIDKEEKQKVSFSELATHLSGGAQFLEQASVAEGVDADGEFWEVKLENLSPEKQFSLSPRPEDTFTITGEYRNNCRGRTRSRRGDARARVNSEGKMSFLLESYVEKVD